MTISLNNNNFKSKIERAVEQIQRKEPAPVIEEMPPIRRSKPQEPVTIPKPQAPEKIETLDDDDKYELPPFLRDRNY